MTRLIAWGQQVGPRTEPQPPGNSLATVAAAYELGYDGVEVDLMLSKDGHLVLMHDWTIDRTTHATGSVSALTLEELRAIQIRDPWDGPPAYVPSFEDALRLNGRQGNVMCDLRTVNQRIIAAMHDAVDRSGFDPSLFLLLAYTPESGRMLKTAFPESVVMLKGKHSLAPPELNAGFVDQADGLDAVIVPTALLPDLTAEFREATAKRGMQLGVYIHWGNPASLVRLFEMGVDYVTSTSHRSFAAAREQFARLRSDLTDRPPAGP